MQKNMPCVDGNAALVIPPSTYQFTKRLGSTTYQVSVHFSSTSKETMNDKIIRLIGIEAAK